MKKTNLKYIVDVFMFLCIVGIAGIGFLMGFFLAEGPTALEREKYFMGLHRHQWGEIHLYLSLAFTFFVILHLILNWNWVKSKTRMIFKDGWKAMLTATAVLAVLIPFIFWIFFPKYPKEYLEYGTGRGRGRVLNPPESQSRITGTTYKQEQEFQTSVEQSRRLEEPLRRKETGKPLSERPRQYAQEEVRQEMEEHEQQLVHGRLETELEGVLIHGQMTMEEAVRITGVPYNEIAAAMNLPSRIPRQESLGRLKRRYGFTMQELRDTIAELIEKKK